MNLSKSRFIAGLQCLKRMYLQVYSPVLAEEPDEKSQALMEQGQEVGRWARKLFPGGALIEAGHEELNKALAQSEQAVANKQLPALFEAAFAHDKILARVDILERLSRGRWRLIEVKSSTSLKDHYVYDVAIQRLILKGCGLNVAPYLMHLNREYIYDGKRYDVKKLFATQDLTAEATALGKEVSDLIREERKVLARATPPDIEAGRQCTNPITCEFYDVCNKLLPREHIRNLPGISDAKLAELRELGIESIGDIPQDFSLTEKQKRARECVRTGRTWFGKGIKEALGKLQYPLSFMDFETLGLALPRFAGMRPYDQIPFQWSVHVQRKPGADLEHYEFLADDAQDPRSAFLKSLIGAIGRTGSVVVYNKGFESGCLKNLARWVPRYMAEIENIQGRLWDLLAVIRAHVYHAAFCGSLSLKSVLPALVPDMTYEGMEVAEGNEAGLVWERMMHGQVDDAERRRLRKALLAYCEQDTLGMVRLIAVLQKV